MKKKKNKKKKQDGEEGEGSQNTSQNTTLDQDPNGVRNHRTQTGPNLGSAKNGRGIAEQKTPPKIVVRSEAYLLFFEAGNQSKKNFSIAMEY